MCSVVSQKNLARKSLPCWLLPWNSPSERRMHCTRRGQKIISCLVRATFGSLAGPVLIWPCMERGKPTQHLLSQLIHSLVSQLQRAAPLVSTRRALLARRQSHPKNLPLFGGRRGGGNFCLQKHSWISAEMLHERCWIFLFVCLCFFCSKKHLDYSLERRGNKNLRLGFRFSFYSHFTAEQI